MMNVFKRIVLLIQLAIARTRAVDPVFSVFMQNKKVLDVACGEGKLLLMNPALVFGIDINTTLVNRLKSEGLNVKFSSVTNIEFTNSAFEVVHCSNIIEHLNPSDAHKMFQEMSRVLVPGGKILLITPMPSTIWNTFGHVKPYPPQAINKLFRKVSLEAFDSVDDLAIQNYFYFGRWGANKITFIISSVVANISPFLRGSYFMIIEKKIVQKTSAVDRPV